MHLSEKPLSWRTHCIGCASKKEKRWGEGRSTLAKFCPNPQCTLFGVPNLVAVKKIVTIDRLGRPHVAHKEMAVRRRPTFTPDGVPA
jgi:hypothetical protein